MTLWIVGMVAYLASLAIALLFNRGAHQKPCCCPITTS